MAVGAWEASAYGPPILFEVDDDPYRIDPAGWYDAAPVLAGFDHPTWPFAVLGRVVYADDWEALFRRALDPGDGLDLPDLRAVTIGLVEATFGRPYYETGRLVGFAVAEWGRLDGVLLLDHGIDLQAMLADTPARVPGLLYAFLARGKNERERFKLDAQIQMPPRGAFASSGASSGADAAAGWGADSEGSSFMSAMQAG